MSPFAYRASDELAAALREHDAADKVFCTRVEQWDAEHPDHGSRWARSPFSADQHFVGFYDGTSEVPTGLSRAKSRKTLLPKRGDEGKSWRAVQRWMSQRPEVERVLHAHKVPSGTEYPSNRDGSFFTAPTRWFDGEDDGVLVYCDRDLATARHGRGANIGEHLTPMPLSEFYAIKERLDAKRAVAS